MTDAPNLIPIALAVIIIVAVFARLAALQRRIDRLARLEAKIDALMKHAGIAYEPARNAPPGVAELLQQGDKIKAIKLYRDATGAGLKEAKDFVDELQRRSA